MASSQAGSVKAKSGGAAAVGAGVAASGDGTAVGSITGNSAPVFINPRYELPDPQHTAAAEIDLAALVEVGRDGDLVRVDELDPYSLGATKSHYGDVSSYRRRDPYVSPTRPYGPREEITVRTLTKRMDAVR
jgi:hypothetical protein